MRRCAARSPIAGPSMTVVVWIAAGLLVWWALARADRGPRPQPDASAPAAPYPPACTSDALLRSFFGEPANYALQPEDRVFRVVGRPVDHDDWDWGRLVYHWRGTAIWIRAIVQSGTVVCVERIEPGNTARFAEAVEVLWERTPTSDAAPDAPVRPTASSG